MNKVNWWKFIRKFFAKYHSQRKKDTKLYNFDKEKKNKKKIWNYVRPSKGFVSPFLGKHFEFPSKQQSNKSPWKKNQFHEISVIIQSKSINQLWINIAMESSDSDYSLLNVRISSYFSSAKVGRCLLCSAFFQAFKTTAVIKR